MNGVLKTKLGRWLAGALMAGVCAAWIGCDSTDTEPEQAIADSTPTPLLAFALWQACEPQRSGEGDDFAPVVFSQASYKLVGANAARSGEQVAQEGLECWKAGDRGCSAFSRCPALSALFTVSQEESCEGVSCGSGVSCQTTTIESQPGPGGMQPPPSQGPAICGPKTGCTVDRCDGDVSVHCIGGVEAREDCKALDPTLKCQLERNGREVVCANGFQAGRNDCEGTVAHSTNDNGEYTISIDCARIGGRCELREGAAFCAR